MRYTSEHDAFLREIRPGRNCDEVIELFKERFGITLTVWQVRDRCRILGVRCHERRGGSNRTPKQDVYAIGDEQVDGRGNVYVKVAEGGYTTSGALSSQANWRKKADIAWEDANGTPLPEGYVVMFADKDRRNFDPENMVAVPIKLSQYVYGMKAQYYDRRTFEIALSMARVRMALNEKRRVVKEVC